MLTAIKEYNYMFLHEKIHWNKNYEIIREFTVQCTLYNATSTQ